MATAVQVASRFRAVPHFLHTRLQQCGISTQICVLERHWQTKAAQQPPRLPWSLAVLASSFLFLAVCRPAAFWPE